MALVRLLGDDQVPAEVREIFSKVSSAYGFVPNLLRAMAHCPELLLSFVPFWGAIYESAALGSRLRALVALGTAKTQACSYCLSHMTASALRAGLSPEQIDAAGSASVVSDLFDDREQILLEYARVLSTDPQGISFGLRTRLRERFTEREIVNLTLAIGLYNLTGRFLIGLDVSLESLFTDTHRPGESPSHDHNMNPRVRPGHIMGT